MSLYNNILKAHFQTQQSFIFHGGSGFGKTATVRAYQTFMGAGMFDIRVANLDPLTMFLPYVTPEGGVIKYKYSEWVEIMMTTKEPLIVFFDEITNPSTPNVFSVVKELLGERTFLGRKISDMVQFIGASNLASEDSGVVDMPDSLWKRATHIAFAPTPSDIVDHLPPMAAKFFASQSELLAEPKVMEFPLAAVPRQITACESIWNTGLLDETEILKVCKGRIGPEAGSGLAAHFVRNGTKSHLPDVLTEESFAYLSELDNGKGKTLEIIQYLSGKKHDPRLVGIYLSMYSSPETARSFMSKKFVCALEPSAVDLKRCPVERLEPTLANVPRLPWTIYAAARGVINLT